MTDQPHSEVNRYARLGPFARALVDDHDAIALAELLVKAHDDLERARRELSDHAEADSADAAAGSYASGQATLTLTITAPNQVHAVRWAGHVRDLVHAEFGASMGLHSFIELEAGGPIAPPADPGPRHWLLQGARDLSIPAHRFTAHPVTPEMERAATERARQAAADSERSAAWLAAAGGVIGTPSCSPGAEETEPNNPAVTEATDTRKQPAHPHPCTATIEGRATPGGRQVQCTREARHPENHVGPKQGSNGKVLWTDWNEGATPHKEQP